jgi:hypothetical protein
MRYRDLTSDDGGIELPASHPFLSELHLDPAVWHDFRQSFVDDPGTRILGHGTPRSGLLKVFVACASREVRSRLEDGWG